MTGSTLLPPARQVTSLLKPARQSMPVHDRCTCIRMTRMAGKPSLLNRALPRCGLSVQHVRVFPSRSALPRTSNPDPRKRIALVEAWAELPDLVTANQGEDGIVELCELLVNRGIGIEAGLLALDDAHRFVAVGVASRCVRAMVEPLDADAGDAIAHAEAIEKVLIDAGITLEQVHHGDGIPTAGAKYSRTVFRSRFRLCAICTCERPASQCTNNSTRSTTSKLLLAIGRSLSHRVGEQQRRHRKRPNPAPPRPSSPWGIT